MTPRRAGPVAGSETPFGLGENLPQFLHLLLQVLLVGLAIGMMRTVVPALAESDFGVPAGSFVLLATLVVAFGAVKAVLNFAAGWLSERIGRKRVLMLGWVIALPVPVAVYFADDWSWIVAATALLGINQGLTWSMTQTSKLDLVRSDQRGIAIGLNEFAGYVGVAVAGIITAYMASVLGARLGILIFGMSVVVVAIALTQIWIRDTLPWAAAGAADRDNAAGVAPRGWVVFRTVTWRDRRLAAISQAGHVEKFVDALVWIIYPIFLTRQDVSLPSIGWIAGIYGLVWGGAQIFTGRLSDRVGRRWPNIAGMWICAVGVAMTVAGSGIAWWSISAAVTGFGMAMLYPNLSAAVADIAGPSWRGSAIGVYRFWRDLGYGVGGLGLGLVAYFTGEVEAAFVFVAACMFLSGLLLWRFADETLPTRTSRPHAL